MFGWLKRLFRREPVPWQRERPARDVLLEGHVWGDLYLDRNARIYHDYKGKLKILPRP